MPTSLLPTRLQLPRPKKGIATKKMQLPRPKKKRCSCLPLCARQMLRCYCLPVTTLRCIGRVHSHPHALSSLGFLST